MTSFERALAFVGRYEKPFMFISSAFGFAFDLVIAKRPDSLFVNILLLTYLCISAGIIIYLHTPARRAGEKRPIQTIVLLLALTFCFGGLASNLLILYGKSGTSLGDLIFLAMLVCVFIGNEFAHDRYEKFRFNIGVWYLLLLSYCIISVPTFILHTIGAREFFISGGISVAVAVVFLMVIDAVVKIFRGVQGRRLLRHSIYIILGIFGFFNVLYFTGIIPPVPLALKQIGIYHSITHTGDTYTAELETAPWWQFWRDSNAVFHLSSTQFLYCFTSVFAPTNLSTPIIHRFEHYDTTAKTWKTESLVTFPIAGGREAGYRGYSIISLPQEGKWRCSIETTSGNLIGRTEFTVIQSSSLPTLVKKAL